MNGIMSWIGENWEILFGGVGTAIVAAIIGRILKKRSEKGKPGSQTTQTITAGDHSKNTTIAGDYVAGDKNVDGQ